MKLSEYNWALPIVDKFLQARGLEVQQVAEVGSRDALDGMFLGKYYKCPVHIFEPDPLNAKECKKNIAELGGGSEIKFHELALANVGGEMDFFSVDPRLYDNRGASGFYLINFDNRGSGDPDKDRGQVQLKVKVQAARFDELNIPLPSLLFMDVQGAELSVLEGFGNGLKNIFSIVFETSFSQNYIGGSTFNSIHDFLCKNGFSFYCKRQNGIVSSSIPKQSLVSKFLNRYMPDFDCVYVNNDIA